MEQKEYQVSLYNGQQCVQTMDCDTEEEAQQYLRRKMAPGWGWRRDTLSWDMYENAFGEPHPGAWGQRHSDGTWT